MGVGVAYAELVAVDEGGSDNKRGGSWIFDVEEVECGLWLGAILPSIDKLYSAQHEVAHPHMPSGVLNHAVDIQGVSKSSGRP